MQFTERNFFWCPQNRAAEEPTSEVPYIPSSSNSLRNNFYDGYYLLNMDLIQKNASLSEETVFPSLSLAKPTVHEDNYLPLSHSYSHYFTPRDR